ncbi:hypothetical protein [Streptomyces hundungensis]|uniref:hypothetical protein n=1 Tax=Streptomyces hundungensis TaxID=1077946 RepID=UPI0031E82227
MAGSDGLLIIADDFDDKVVTTLVVNTLRAVWKAVVVKSPPTGSDEEKVQTLRDIAEYTRASIGSKDLGLEPGAMDMGHLGRAGIVVGKDKTTLTNGEGAPRQAN